MRKLGGHWPDREISVTLNRMKCRTEAGETWTAMAVRLLRERLSIPDFDPSVPRPETLTADKAATPVDWLALTLGGARIQDANWQAVVRRVGEMAGGTVDPVRWTRRYASDAEVRHLSTWVARLIEARHA